MSLSVFLIVLFAAALHATWNAVVKGGRDTLLTTVLIAVTGGLIGLAALPFLPPVSAESFLYLSVSAVLEITYYALVAGAYRRSDMSRAYPLMRGTPPLLIALASSFGFGVSISAFGWLGVALISGGLLSLLLASGDAVDPRGVRFALANAVVIAAYTLVDGFGVRVSGAPATYTMWIFVLTGLPLGVWALFARRDFGAYVRANWMFGLIGGLGTMVSYGLALWAMTEAPVPLVAALRETSILFGTIIAAVVLGERVTPVRLAAVLIIAAGAITLRLA